MIVNNKLIALCLWLVATTTFAAPAKEVSAWKKHAENNHFNGAVLVAVGNDIVLKRGFGIADKENKRAFSANSVFDILSVTKQFTATAILKLEEKGLLSVNDTIGRFFKDIPNDKKAITLHQLLTHTSGLKSDFKEDYEVVSRDDLIQGAFRSKLQSTPGTHYEYSNVGYSLLGIIIEKVSGLSYEKFLNEKLFSPAGMSETGYKLPRWQAQDLVAGYDGNNRWGTPLEHEWAEDGPWWNLKANGGLLSTLTDLHKWHIALKGELILSDASKLKLFSPYVAENEAATSHYGYGWAVFKTRRNTKLVAHNGGNPYFFSDFRHYSDENILILFATNDRSKKNFKQYGRLIKAVFADLKHKEQG
ncbi:serine hydrolase domain-containing protein [Thalassomonas haliotis]|uniref:Serine hydrolase n=1 Tax=Thalassomonas haliotis TaxID=485448 RepID=A0ABY7VAB4_9GAMM|nr:serine hydrolase domain-containing protein [Thalassomonas haliotis]WDE10271.1 serine hydrolase [Thalassomonas haliotis]